MLSFSGEPTEIVEIPVIVVNDKVELNSPEMRSLNEASLKDIALAMNGQFLYLKLRATYSMPEVVLCTAKGCYRPVEKDLLTCGDH